MSQPTVAEYTLTRLFRLGIDRVFGVPGDYALSVNDAVEVVDGLDWVACANELNAAYAADGYARIRGAAILSTTYGVGELSALNGVMGSKAHRLPVFHIVGMPSERIQHLKLITHHNLGDTRYDRYHDISSSACCVSARLTPDNCIDELERVIREALRLMAEKDSEQSLKLASLRADLQQGVASVEAGRASVFDPEQIKARARLAQQG